AVDVEGDVAVLDDVVAVLAEGSGDAGAPREVVVVAEHRDDAARAQPGQLGLGVEHLVAAPAHVVAGHDDDVGATPVGELGRGGDVLGRRHRPDVDVGQLRDADAVEAWVEAGDGNLVLGDDGERDAATARHRCTVGPRSRLGNAPRAVRSAKRFARPGPAA